MRRVLLVLAVAVALVVGHGASSPSVALAADPIDVLDAVIVEDFEWGEDGVNLSSAATYDAPLPWQTTTPGTTTIKIKEDGAYEGDQFVRMTRPTTSQTPWLFFDWIVSDNTFGVSMAVRHDASTSNTIMLGGPYGSQYCITILARPTGVLETMNHASQYVDSGGRLSSNTWGLITIKAPDFTNGTFRLWLDETYLGQFEMFGSSDYNEVFRISSTTNAVGVTDYDYIIVQPVVLTGPVIALEGTFGTLSAYASTAAWDDITDVGFVWDTSPIAFPPLGTPPSDFEPEGNGGWWEGGDEGWEADDWFFHFIYSLDAETEYYYRAAVKVGSQWIYGKQESFETGEAPPPELSPTVRTDNATNITHEGAKLNGYIESPGSDEKCDYYGFVWGKTSQSDPGDTAPGDTDYASYWTAVPALATGPISRVITVDPDTVYYFRACAHNSQGWAYGAELSFRSLKTPARPTVTTDNATGITHDSAVLWGTVDDPGSDESPTYYGFVWGKTSQSDPGDTAPGLSGYTYSWTAAWNYALWGPAGEVFHGIAMDPETRYYYRMCANNSQGWAYGEELSFMTLEAPEPPTVVTAAATDISNSEAVLRGYIVSPGDDEECDYYGFVWDTETHSDPGNVAPFLSGYDWSAVDVPDGATGPTAHRIDVDSDTRYYFRACAHNSGGWTYGAEFWFDSLSPDEGEPPIPVPPVTMDVSGISNGILLAVLTALLMFASVAGDWKRFWPLIIIASIGWFFTAGWAMYLSLTAHDGYWVAAIICVGMALATIMWPLIVKGPATAIEQVSDEDDAWGGKRKKRYPRRLDID